MNTKSQITNPVYCLKEVLNTVKNRITEVETRLERLKTAALGLVWGSAQANLNYQEQRFAWGELNGLAIAQGALEGRISVTEAWIK